MIKSGRKEQLDNLVIRPNIVGKKTLGNLEIH
jgi:nucleosome binding factor SPN SPT16 subunit